MTILAGTEKRAEKNVIDPVGKSHCMAPRQKMIQGRPGEYETEEGILCPFEPLPPTHLPLGLHDYPRLSMLDGVCGGACGCGMGGKECPLSRPITATAAVTISIRGVSLSQPNPCIIPCVSGAVEQGSPSDDTEVAIPAQSSRSLHRDCLDPNKCWINRLPDTVVILGIEVRVSWPRSSVEHTLRKSSANVARPAFLGPRKTLIRLKFFAP